MAQSYDRQRGNEDGLFWQRRFFASDYKTGTAMQKAMGLHVTDRIRIHNYCLSKEAVERWFPNQELNHLF